MLRVPQSALLGVVLAAVSICVLPSMADDKPGDKYSETGNVLSTISKRGHFYQVGTDSKIYLLLCTKVKSLQFGEPECKVDGKPIATGNAIHFRVEGDFAYMPPVAGESMEEKLRILATELKVTPPLPPAPSAANPTTGSSSTAAEGGVVVGTGTHVKGQKSGSWSTTRSLIAPAVTTSSPGTPIAPAITTASPGTPVMATAPVTAIPVTGGPPVMVTPVGPTTGGVVTGVPVTGGPPITAIPTAPVTGVPVTAIPTALVTGVPVGGAPAGGGSVVMGAAAPQWVHILRIQTAGKIYQLECSSKPCTLGNKEIALGDTLTIRVDKKHAYLSSDSQGSPSPQEFKLLEESDVGTSADAKPH